MRLFLIRHGRTVNNVEQMTQGWADTPLDDLGVKQAQEVAKYFDPISLSHIFSSDLQRSFDTAVPTGLIKSIEVVKSSLLRERSLGKLENAPMSDLRQAFEDEIERTGESRCKVSPQGVESAYDVMARVTKFAKLIPKEESDVAIFTHGMTEECLLCHLIGAPVESSRSFNFDNASITSLHLDRDVWILESYNETTHLSNPTSRLVD